ncbi:hypothetical protein L1S32_09040 [Methanogenium sp. S4BF]|uniref:hypothetical protein n=1 Tax=Methanogenium sp. S4BF TaxID=1789226 RepID=UPI0024178E05|nr:hypothetical protein [Methanogenium sp. S4BF]WFN33987.1 hypothetical protein L1S32_09040 [Methanogenium sp. S4BF]
MLIVDFSADAGVKTPEGDIQDAEIFPDEYISPGVLLADGSVVIDIPFSGDSSYDDEPGHDRESYEDDDI